MILVIKVCLSFLLGVTFLISAIPKLRRPKGFVLTVLEHRILPPLLGRIYGWFLPLLELLLALLLLSGTYIRLAALVLSLLLLSFIFSVSINLARGRDLNCGCFGTKKQRKISWKLLLEDFVLLGLALSLASLSSNWIGLEEPWSIFRLISHLASPLALLLCEGITLGIALFLRKKAISQGKRHAPTLLASYNAERINRR